MHQIPLPCFLPKLPLPSWSFSLPLLWHTPPCIFASTAPIPQIEFCLTPLLTHRFLLRLYARIFSSLQISGIPSCILSQLPSPSPMIQPPFLESHPPPLCTYLKNSYASDCVFLTSTTPPSWSFSLPLLWHTQPCIVLRQLPLLLFIFQHGLL